MPTSKHFETPGKHGEKWDASLLEGLMGQQKGEYCFASFLVCLMLLWWTDYLKSLFVLIWISLFVSIESEFYVVKKTTTMGYA